MIKLLLLQSDTVLCTRFRIACLLSLIVYLPCIFFHQRGYQSAIPASRLDLLHSIVEDGVLNIDRFQENTPDKAFFENHYYSDKAPATIFLAFPFFKVSASILSFLGNRSNTPFGWLFTSWISCAFSQAILAATGAGGLFLWLCRRVGSRAAFLASAGIAIGGSPMAYSSILMSHSATFGLLAWSLYLGDTSLCKFSKWWRSILIGCCLGLSVAGEYSSGIVVLGILLQFRKEQNILFSGICIGSLPGMILIIGYNMACFGNPVSFGYQHQVVFTQMHYGFFGIKWPNWSNLCYLTFGFRQGMFLWSPVLLMAFIGFCLDRADLKSCLRAFYCTALANLVILSGYFFPEAGMTLGARLLSPIIVLLALPVAIGIERFKLLGYTLVLLSIVTTIFMVSVDIRLPNMDVSDMFKRTWNDLFAGRTSFNLCIFLGLHPLAGTISLILAIVAGLHLGLRSISNLSPPEVSTTRAEVPFASMHKVAPAVKDFAG